MMTVFRYVTYEPVPVPPNIQFVAQQPVLPLMPQAMQQVVLQQEHVAQLPPPGEQPGEQSPSGTPRMQFWPTPQTERAPLAVPLKSFSGDASPGPPGEADKCEVGRYTILCGVPVCRSVSRQSPQVGELARDACVEVVEIAEHLEEGRVRGRISSPAGWISLRHCETQTCYATLVQASRSQEKRGPQACRCGAVFMQESNFCHKCGRLRRALLPEDMEKSDRDSEFQVLLDKSTNMELGVDVDISRDGKGLQMEHISGGLVEKWNLENPEKAVKQGDLIIEVNNIRNDAQLLVAECKQNKVLKMLVRRPGTRILSI
jgi:hypothetical protein